MKDNYNRNNNPFVLWGTMGRLAFFVSNSLLVILSTVILVFSCKSALSFMDEPLLTQNYSQLYLIFNNSPKLETFIFILVLLCLIAFRFIFVKKRMLDIEQKNINGLRNSYIVATLSACIPVMANCVVPVTSKMNTVLFVVSLLITFCLIVKKGAQ